MPTPLRFRKRSVGAPNCKLSHKIHTEYKSQSRFVLLYLIEYYKRKYIYLYGIRENDGYSRR